MTILKPISGHTGLAKARAYLERDGRALARDFLNLDAPELPSDGPLPSYGEFDWASVMDATRAEFGNDAPWGDRRARTYKHYIVSPDPRDGVDLETLRSLALEWAERHFGEHEVAIVYHDDHAGRIPHAVEFRSVLSAISVEVADNSVKATRRDWVYSMEGHPTWRIASGFR